MLLTGKIPNWYPGHMAKAMTRLRLQLRDVDLVIEVRDARIPKSCQNPIFDGLCLHIPKLIVYNKVDLTTMTRTRTSVESNKGSKRDEDKSNS